MPIESTRPTFTYVLSDPDDWEAVQIDHARRGWNTAAVFAPLSGSVDAPSDGVDQRMSLHLRDQPVITLPNGTLPTNGDVIESDYVLVKAFTRDDYNAAHPSSPLPEVD